MEGKKEISMMLKLAVVLRLIILVLGVSLLLLVVFFYVPKIPSERIPFI